MFQIKNLQSRDWEFEKSLVASVINCNTFPETKRKVLENNTKKPIGKVNLLKM